MNELPLYQIVDWNNQFENNRSRTVDHCTFVCVPNDESPTIHAILNNSDGPAILGILLLLLKLCSRQRKPRHGYLTTSGQKDGWRLGADELGVMWKIPPAVVRRALAVLQTPQVDLIRIVAGSPRNVTPSDMTAVTPSDMSAVTPSVLAAAEQVTFQNVTPSDMSAVTPSVLDDVNEGMKEGMKEPPSIPQGGTEMSCLKSGQSEQVETDRHDMNIDDAKAWVNSLFGRQRAWSYEEQSGLSKLLPISKEDRALLSWAYTLPRDSEGWALIRGNRASKPKQSPLLLVREFSSEVDKWNHARTTFGLNGQKKAVEREEDLDLTPEQVAAAKKIYGDDAPLPKKWGQLAPQVRREITEAMAT